MKRVLIVDDELDIRELVTMGLAPIYDTLSATNGREALEIVLAEPVHAMVLDVNMPLMTGIELLAELARRGRSVPVVVTSAEATLREFCKELELVSCLAKPYKMAALLDELAKVIAIGPRATPAL